MTDSSHALASSFAIFGNAVVDGVAHVSDKVLKAHKLSKGDTNLLSLADFLALSAEVPIEAFHSGGSGANTAYTLASLGQKVGFIGMVGSEPAGEHFFSDMVALGVAMTPPQDDVKTLEVLILITPDGARTMVQPSPLPPTTSDHWVEDALYSEAGWMVLEGYAACAHPGGAAYLLEHKNPQQKALVMLPAPHVCQKRGAIFEKFLKGYDGLIVGNEKEYAALASSWPELPKLLATIPHVVTASGGAAEFVNGKQRVRVAADKVDCPIDSTGAGDAFVAGFLLEYSGSGDPEKALRRGHQLARAVIMQTGPRLLDPAAVWSDLPV